MVLRERDDDGRFTARWPRRNLEDLPRLPVSAGLLALSLPTDGLLAVWPDPEDASVAAAVRKLVKTGPTTLLVTNGDLAVSIEIKTRPAPHGGFVAYWRCPSCGASRVHLYLLPVVRCRGCTYPRLRFQSEGRTPCRIPAALLAGKPAAELGAVDMIAVMRLAAQADREIWDPILICDPTRAVGLFSNAGWTEAG